MENKLISMVEFVQWIKFEPPKTDEDHSNHFGYKFGMVCKYANFLNTPLNLGMFVPAIEVDGKWEVLEWKEPYQEGNVGNNRQFQQAKDKVIFEGKEIVANIWEFYKGKTIQSLIKHNYTLTEYGKQISGLNK